MSDFSNVENPPQQITPDPQVKIVPIIQSPNRMQALSWRRRTMAAITLATTATFAGGFVNVPMSESTDSIFPPSPIVEPYASNAQETSPVVSALESKIETRFGIKIVDKLQGLALSGRLPDSQEEIDKIKADPNSQWNEMQLLGLYEAILRAPDKFIRPNGTSFLSIGITDYDYDNECYCLGSFHDMGENMDLILIASDYLDKSGMGAEGTIFHEGFHRFEMGIEKGQLRPELFKIFGVRDFTELRNKYYPTFKRGVDMGIITSPFLWDLEYGFLGKDGTGMDDPKEFLAVLATIYLGGESEFMNMSDIFGEEISTRAYDFYRNRVFDGVEYPQGQNLNERDEIDLAEEYLNLMRHKYSISFISHTGRINLEQARSIFNTFNILPDNFRRLISDDSGPQRDKLQITIGEENRLVSDNEIIIDKEHLKPGEIFLNLGLILARRGEGYQDLKGKLSIVLSRDESDPKTVEDIDRLLYTYMRGTFFMGGIQSVAPEISNYGDDFESSKAKYVYDSIKEYFEGNEYLENYNDDSGFGVLQHIGSPLGIKITEGEEQLSNN